MRGKPMLLIPLSSKASREDQILNSKYEVDKGYAKMLLEEEMNARTFVEKVERLYKQKSLYISRLNSIQSEDAIKKQLEYIYKWSK
ncbi:MAG: glycosyltransferase [Cellulosilyticaceae bacterium]